jgi:hypothetical protein
MEIDMGVEVTDARPAAQVVAERLARLAAGAGIVEAAQSQTDSNDEIIEAEVVEIEEGELDA